MEFDEFHISNVPPGQLRRVKVLPQLFHMLQCFPTLLPVVKVILLCANYLIRLMALSCNHLQAVKGESFIFADERNDHNQIASYQSSQQEPLACCGTPQGTPFACTDVATYI